MNLAFRSDEPTGDAYRKLDGSSLEPRVPVGQANWGQFNLRNKTGQMKSCVNTEFLTVQGEPVSLAELRNQNILLRQAALNNFLSLQNEALPCEVLAYRADRTVLVEVNVEQVRFTSYGDGKTTNCKCQTEKQFLDEQRDLPVSNFANAKPDG